MKIQLIAHSPDPLKLMYAQTRGTTTHASFAEVHGNSASRERQLQLVADALDSGHWSVSRGVTFGFSISGVSRACAQQLTRQVQGVAWEMASQRYQKVDTTEDWFVTPPEVTRQGEAFQPAIAAGASSDLDSRVIYHQAMEQAAWAYHALMALGIPGEDARMVLPNAARTNLIGTFSFEALKNFLGQRLCTRAQLEIRDVAKAMRKEALRVVPWAGPWLTIKCMSAGRCDEKRPAGCALLVENGGKVPWKYADQPVKVET